MDPETFIELRCLVAACRSRGMLDEEIELILLAAGLDVEDFNDLMYRWQTDSPVPITEATPCVSCSS